MKVSEVKGATKMAKALFTLFQKHGVSPEKAECGYLLKLKNNGYMDLVIEKVDTDQISVAHYFESNGDLVADPEVVFYFDFDDTGKLVLAPESIIQVFGGYQEVSEKKPCEVNGYTFSVSSPKQYADVLEFCQMWGQNIIDQGWADDDVIVVARAQ